MARLRHQRAGARNAGRARSRRAGFAPGAQVAIALDVAASEFGRGGKYKLALEDKELDSDGMIKLLTGWIGRYPIVSIEDPLAEDDDVGFAAFTHAVGARVQVIGDDFLVIAGIARARGGAARRRQRGAAEAQPARHADRDARGLAGGASRRASPASSRRAPARPRT